MLRNAHLDARFTWKLKKCQHSAENIKKKIIHKGEAFLICAECRATENESAWLYRWHLKKKV